jgi:hypothetical protein
MSPFYVGLLLGLTITPCLFLLAVLVWVLIVRGE